MRTSLCFLLFLVMGVPALSQTDGPVAARRLALDATRQADSGRYDRALELLNQARRLAPDVPEYGYELASVHARKRDYRRAVEVLTILVKRPNDAADRWYKLLGDSYDSLGDRKKAMAAYAAGVKRFPRSGLLHMECGLAALAAKDTLKALRCWENGIRNEPGFSSNYYHAARLCCAASRRLWGLLYGEMFINLEPATSRAAEIGALLFQAYRASYSFGDSVLVNFMPIPVRNGKPVGKKKGGASSASRVGIPAAVPMAVPFGTIHGIVAVKFVEGEDGGMVPDTAITLARLSGIREAFIDEWYRRGLQKQYPNTLLAWQKQMFDAGHSEAYTYWVLGQGAPEEFRVWRGKNNAKLDAFMRTIVDRPIQIDTSQSLVRSNTEL